MRSLLISLLALLVLSTAPAAAQPAAATAQWTPALAMQYHAIGGTAMAPDGQLVAYVVRAPLMEGEQSEYRSQIHVASVDGSMNVPNRR